MNKNAIQKYAIWARNELIEQVNQRAYQYGISDKDYGDENAAVISGRVLSQDEKRQRTAFVHEIKKHGYQEVVEEVAYTWFNRFVALRFMEVNDYLPTHVRVFSDATGGFNPELLKDILHLDLDGLDKAKVSELLNANKTEELYRYLLLTQCNALNVALPEMFEKLGGYTEMLLPNNILKQDSILARLVKDIDEDDWKDAVQIIGWMYQYYNTEPKQAVFDGLKKNVKITKEKIPAATQLFTPDWIVRYMVENSLGRLWLESHPNSTLKENWKYYIDEAEQTPEVAERLRVLRSQSPVKSPEDIRLIDPCMGSGHILVYAFDVLMQIYESVGVGPRDAAKLILEKNIYGLDIDRRAYQLSYFSLMMKARQYNRRIFTDQVKPQVYHPGGFPEGEEYGSLVKVDTLPQEPEEPKEITFFTEGYETTINAWNFKRLLAQKYDVVVTNPPYMGFTSMTDKLSDYVKTHYFDGKADMFSVFILRCNEMAKESGFYAMITQPSLLSLSSFEKLRKVIMTENSISSLLHMGRGIFGIDFGSTSFVIRKSHMVSAGHANYFRLHKRTFQYIEPDDIEKLFLKSKDNHNLKFDFDNYDTKIGITDELIKQGETLFFASSQEMFLKVPGNPFSYWFSNSFIDSFEQSLLGTALTTREGMATADNERFLRFWFEININQILFGCANADEAQNNGFKWFPYNKGGDYRKWYGNNEYVVDWYDNGRDIRSNIDTKTRRIRSHNYNGDYGFRNGITWSSISAGDISVRWSDPGFLFDSKGAKGFCVDNKKLLSIQGLLNSKVAKEYLKVFSPTMDFKVGDIIRIPIFDSVVDNQKIQNTVSQLISSSRSDWDSFESSWDFKRHPLICGECEIASAFIKWERESEKRFDDLKANEEELNHIFIDIYSLENELTPKVEDKAVSVRRADLKREIRSLISYAVGCMFGRYSLDTEGLSYAGGDWDEGKYCSFIPDKDNILPICDDEYFDDDILGRFVDFIRIVYGADTLEENLKFIADALVGRGTPREIIRNYFLNGFYTDHCKIYQKRPIYWLFDSGKKNGFKSLVYLHRYSRDLLAKLRTDYVHEQQERYRTQLSHIAAALITSIGSDRARLTKQQDKLSEQLKEITAFEEKVHHLADQNIEIDLDDGVKKNYEIFTDILAKI